MIIKAFFFLFSDLVNFIKLHGLQLGNDVEKERSCGRMHEGASNSDVLICNTSFLSQGRKELGQAGSPFISKEANSTGSYQAL